MHKNIYRVTLLLFFAFSGSSHRCFSQYAKRVSFDVTARTEIEAYYNDYSGYKFYFSQLLVDLNGIDAILSHYRCPTVRIYMGEFLGWSRTIIWPADAAHAGLQITRRQNVGFHEDHNDCRPYCDFSNLTITDHFKSAYNPLAQWQDGRDARDRIQRLERESTRDPKIAFSLDIAMLKTIIGQMSAKGYTHLRIFHAYDRTPVNRKIYIVPAYPNGRGDYTNTWVQNIELCAGGCDGWNHPGW